MSNRQHLDHAAVNELKEVMGNDFSVLIETFLKDSKQRLKSLEGAIAQCATEQLCQTAHSFKGSSSNLGALQLSQLCQSLEELGRSGSLVGGKTLLEELLVEFAAVEAEMLKIVE